jgi:hypothetical protein
MENYYQSIKFQKLILKRTKFNVKKKNRKFLQDCKTRIELEKSKNNDFQVTLAIIQV